MLEYGDKLSSYVKMKSQLPFPDIINHVGSHLCVLPVLFAPPSNIVLILLFTVTTISF